VVAPNLASPNHYCYPEMVAQRVYYFCECDSANRISETEVYSLIQPDPSMKPAGSPDAGNGR
jgi:hypothetical protein